MRARSSHGSDDEDAAIIPRWQLRGLRPSQPVQASAWRLWHNVLTLVHHLCRSPLLCCILVLALLAFFPLLRRSYIMGYPERPISSRQDPHWWTDPWTLPASRFPKITIYPDVDWNPRPVRLAGAIRQLVDRPSPWNSTRCDDESHLFRRDNQASFSGAADGSSPLLYIGIFSMVTSQKEEIRNVIRRRALPRYRGTNSVDEVLGADSSMPSHPHGDMGTPPGVLEVNFILAYPRGWSHTVAMLSDGTLAPLHTSLARVATWQGNGVALWRSLLLLIVPWTGWEQQRAQTHIALMTKLAEEQRNFSDLAILPHEEQGMNSGKTYHFFRFIAQSRGHNASKQPPSLRPPRFVMKMDDDTFPVLPNLLQAFANLSCSQPAYIGTSWGCTQSFPFHFGGLGYALSWPLVVWLGNTSQPLPWWHTRGDEDARLGAYLLSLREPVVTVDYGVKMGSWYDDRTFPKDGGTIALHYLKETKVYREQSERMWHIDSKEWRWEGARPWVERHETTRAQLGGEGILG